VYAFITLRNTKLLKSDYEMASHSSFNIHFCEYSVSLNEYLLGLLAEIFFHRDLDIIILSTGYFHIEFLLF
jgi:hypothetical protein